MNEQETMIDLSELILVVRKHLLLIVITTLVFALVAFSITKYVVDEKFESNTTIFIETDDEHTSNASNYSYNTKLVNEFSVLIKSRTVLNKVIDELNLTDYDHKDLQDMITVTAVKDTRIIDISVTSTDKYLSRDIANAIALIFGEEIQNTTEIKAIRIIDKAIENENPVGPNVVLNTVIGFILGGMVSLGYVFIIEFMDNRIKSADDIEKYLGVSVLGVVPDKLTFMKNAK